MLVWLQNITVIRADLLKASIPWTNADDAFLVADTQKSDKSCLAVHMGEDAFIQSANGANSLQFHYTEEEAKRNLRTYITTLLGSLLCRSDVQVADGKAMLLKYVTSYVTKMHEACTSEGFYSSDVTGYQAAHSFFAHSASLSSRNDLSTFQHQASLDEQNDQTIPSTLSRPRDGKQVLREVLNKRTRQGKHVSTAMASQTYHCAQSSSKSGRRQVLSWSQICVCF